MSIIPRHLALALLLATTAASCGGREAELVLQIERRSHPGGLELYVCDAAPTTPCKRADVLVSGDQRAAREVGIFINDSPSKRMDLNFQLEGPAACAHFEVDYQMDPEVKVLLAPDGALPITVLDCTSCTVPDLVCTYVGRGS